VIIVVVLSIYYSYSLFVTGPANEDVDLFGIDKIYSTKEGGHEWYIDMENPFSDNLFSCTFDRSIIRHEDGSWRIVGA
jgi:hypothetical protein